MDLKQLLAGDEMYSLAIRHSGSHVMEFRTSGFETVCKITCQLKDVPALARRHREWTRDFVGEPYGLPQLFALDEEVVEPEEEAELDEEEKIDAADIHFIGIWNSPDFLVGIVFPRSRTERFQPNDHRLLVFFKPMKGSRRIPIGRVREASVELCEDPEIARPKGFGPESYSIANVKGPQTLTGSQNPTYVVQFPSSKWKRPITAFGDIYGHPHCFLEMTLTYDISGPTSYMGPESPNLQTSASRFLEFLTHTDYFHLFLGYLDSRTVKTLQGTSKLLRLLFRGAISSRIQRQLEVTFPGKLPELRECLKWTNAVISGSTALRCLVPSDSWEAGDLDILVHRTSAVQVKQFLLDNNYQPGASSRFHILDPEAPFTPYPGAWTYFPHYHAVTGRKVDLCVYMSQTWGPVSAILKYHSSVVMNYVTASRLICIFPEQTLAGVNLRNAYQPDSAKAEAGIEKYSRRGFRMSMVEREGGGEVPRSIQSVVRPQRVNAGLDWAYPETDEVDNGPDGVGTGPDGVDFGPDGVDTDLDDNDEDFTSLPDSRPLKPEEVYPFAWGTFFSWAPLSSDDWIP